MYILPKLPFALNELEPFLSEEIISLHYNKHHQSYVDKLNKIINTYDPTLFSLMNETTMAMYINTFPIDIRQNLKNQLGGHINHSFFWSLLSIKNTNEFKKLLEPMFNNQFGSIEQAFSEFKNIISNHFGSGWVWFCYNPISEKVEIRAYNNQDCPLFDNMYPLLGIDLWEHSYYLQYKNNKMEYVENFIKLLNWQYIYELFNSYTENKDNDSCCSDSDCREIDKCC